MLDQLVPILNLAEFGVDRLAPNLKAALLQSGHQLHLSETEQLYLDGGVSARKIAEDVQHAIHAFIEAVAPVYLTNEALLVAVAAEP